jgi:hypothetical protein
MVYSVCSVCLVYLVEPDQLNEPNKPDRPDEPDRLRTMCGVEAPSGVEPLSSALRVAVSLPSLSSYKPSIHGQLA